MAIGIAQSPAQRNTTTFDYEDAFCSYRGYYDKSKYTEQQLKDTYTLTSWGVYFSGKDEEELTMNYHAMKNRLQALHLVNIALYSDARDSILRYVDESYAVQRIRIKAQDDPSVLFSVFQDDEKIRYYATVLNAQDSTLLKAYRTLIKEKMTVNADPESLWRRYQSHMRSDYRHELAFDYVLDFGWWNQVNSMIYHYPHDGKLEEHFGTLFDKVEVLDCEEP